MADNENPNGPTPGEPSGDPQGTPPAPSGTPNPAQPAQDDDEDKPLSAEEAKAIRAALKSANKEAEKNRLKLKEIDDANLSELQKAQRDAAEAKTEADNLRKDNLRKTVALNAGLPGKWAERLRGDTEEEMAADAATILADLGKPKTPAPDPSQGPRQTPKTSGWDAGKAEAQKRFAK
jgi:hypothetical protein